MFFFCLKRNVISSWCIVYDQFPRNQHFEIVPVWRFEYGITFAEGCYLLIMLWCKLSNQHTNHTLQEHPRTSHTFMLHKLSTTEESNELLYNEIVSQIVLLFGQVNVNVLTWNEFNSVWRRIVGKLLLINMSSYPIYIHISNSTDASDSTCSCNIQQRHTISCGECITYWS